ncbi:hypothetical protein V2K52_25690 [Pseudomonas alliivorans]|nr:hypothetical protein [Pseudomonas alliivorans]MEE4795937.1 hypothetical protein [Pseudomonas alliivorans]MEE4800965.1 hypothetical protein [Pseudomonas alliivorans]MEE4811086.1 hypothetical protein [Pseudomonas alliivorans]MEE4826259.1 hypothetical protein [Pseudomonas alliivorans]
MQIIYLLFVRKNERRLSVLEAWINYIDGDLVFSEDFLRNEPEMYEELFSLKCKGYVLGLLEKLMAEMKGLRFEESERVLDGLEFVQNVGATALWKFNCNLDAELRSFVREFDRLDSVEERKRLYSLAQA